MYKNIFFILLIAFAAVGTIFAFKQTGQSMVQSTSSVNETAVMENTKTNLYQEKNDIEVSIEQFENRDQDIVLTLALNNHRYDLGQDSIYETATLNGQPSTSHTFLSNAVGGHHVQTKIFFEKTTSGSLEITPVEGTTFTFSDLW